jgi:UDP-N-acetylmuramyl pentapeptide phosphotransferase/UDP-N-acetylglucosamine-1-phosphate transferase
MEPILLLSIFISFFSALIFLPIWIKKCHQVGLLWEDMNKSPLGKVKNIASSGGLVVVMAFLFGVLSYIAIRTFFLGDTGQNLQIFSIISSISILAIIGLVDDLLGWKNGGLSPRFRIFLVLSASIPLIVINVGTHQVFLPFLGKINLGILYTFLIVPIGILGATTT